MWSHMESNHTILLKGEVLVPLSHKTILASLNHKTCKKIPYVLHERIELSSLDSKSSILSVERIEQFVKVDYF